MELLNCPFCGRRPELTTGIGIQSLQVPAYHFVHCLHCGNLTCLCGTENEAISKWNRRVSIKESGETSINNRFVAEAQMPPDCESCPVEACVIAGDNKCFGSAVCHGMLWRHFTKR